MEEDNKIQENTNYSIYRSIFMFYAQITSWIIAPLGVGILIVKITDNRSLFFPVLVLGFFITIFGIYKEIKKYKKDLETEDQDKENGDK